MRQRKALIVGGSGLVGTHLAQALRRQGGWQLACAQRRPPTDTPFDEMVSVDILGDTQPLAALRDVTHLFFLARVWEAGYVIGHQPNVTALRNVLDVVQDWPTLRHVQLVHGLKWYGSTAGPFPTPACETDQPAGASHFYYDQRALVAGRQQGRGWHWSTLRPHCVSGIVTGSPSNIMLGIGVYASLRKAQGRPLEFPGSSDAFEAELTYTSANLLARAMAWAAESPAARNEDFNVANGDVFRWCDVWPSVARLWNMEAGPARPVVLREEMPALADCWHDLARRHGLREPDLAALVDWSFMDATLALRWDQTMALDKIRASGFTEAEDSPAMIHGMLQAYRALNILPTE